MVYLVRMFLVAMALPLAGCGGGGGAADSQGATLRPLTEPSASAPANVLTAPDPLATVQRVTTFADGSGLLRVEGAGQNHLVLVPDAAAFDPAKGGVTIDPASILILADAPEGTLFGAEGVTGAGAPVVVALWRNDCDVDGDCTGPGLAYLRAAEGGFLGVQAFGPAPSALPGGSFTYAGAHLLALSGDRGLQAGSFEMRVNFDTARAALSAVTDDFTVSGGGIVIDLVSGRFAGGGLDISGLEAAPVSARIEGSFHGEGATGLSAVYHENAVVPRVFGVIAGSR